MHYFHSCTDLAKCAKKNTDLNLFEDERDEEGEATNGTGKAIAKNGNTLRGTHVELRESKPMQELLGQLSRKGLPVEHYAAQDKPLFELIDGDREVRDHPLFYASENLATAKEIGGRGGTSSALR